jgi:hypothetical protein
MSELYSEGGWTMYPTTLFGVLTVVVALVLAVRPERRFVPLFISTSALTIMTGMLGTVVGLTGVVKAAANADAVDLKEIITACATQALNSMLVALVCVVVALLGVGAGALRVATTRSTTA